ncbi:MAG: hypothetical protein ACR2MX_06920 [Cyclobacteriaceae bacterium]
MRIGIIIICLALTSSAWGQGIDEDRMRKDLEVGENVLSALLKQDSEWPMKLMSGIEVEGEYMDGFGVVFNIESNSWFNLSGFRNDCDDCDDQDGHDYQYKIKNKGKWQGGNSRVMVIDDDSIARGSQQKVREVMEEFIVDYADLIGQLKPTDRIQLKHESSTKGIEVFLSDGKSYNKKGGGYLSAEILKGDISDYKSGKLNKEQLIKKIRIEESDGGTKKEADLELLASIFNRLYKSDLSETYFVSQGPEYERINGLGIIYHMKTFSSYQEGNRFRMPTIDERGLTEDERNELVMEIYPEFVDELKENMVVYGRTLKNLSDGESLIFKVKMTKCDGCDLPKSMEFSVKGSVLEDYDRNKISLDNAAEKVSVKEN